MIDHFIYNNELLKEDESFKGVSKETKNPNDETSKKVDNKLIHNAKKLKSLQDQLKESVDELLQKLKNKLGITKEDSKKEGQGL